MQYGDLTPPCSGSYRVWHTRHLHPPRVTNPYTHHRFPAEMISQGVWLSCRFCLSYRDVEELMLDH